MNQLMQLKQLQITRSEWGADKGKLSGAVKFMGPHGQVKLPLDEQLSQDILKICADGVVRASQQIATELTADVMNECPALLSQQDPKS